MVNHRLQLAMRVAATTFFLAAGCVLLVINSGLLSRGASRWADEWFEKISYGTVAALVPWFIALIPVLIALLWHMRKRKAALVLVTVEAILIAYNLVGMIGSIAAVRDDVISQREYAAAKVDTNIKARKRLQDEWDKIPAHRPIASVDALLKAEKAKWQYDDTNRCKDISRGSHARFCQNVAALEAELAAGKRAAEIAPQLGALEGKFEEAGATSKTSDWTARTLTLILGGEEQWVRERLPIATPIVLEILSAISFYFASIFAGINHRGLFFGDAEAPAPPQREKGKDPGDPTRQRELAEWYFSHYARPVASGVMLEDRWYQDYCEICSNSRDVPLNRDAFRQIAAKVHGLTIHPVEGRTYYKGVLPLRAKEVA
jgi:hypothetical protein